MSQPAKLDELLRVWWASEECKRGRRLLRERAGARTVPTMTTRHEDYDRQIQLVGELLAENIDRVEDDRVIGVTKEFIHEVLDNGSSEDLPYGPSERKVWDLVEALGYTPLTDVWKIESSIFRLIDEYDLFND